MRIEKLTEDKIKILVEESEAKAWNLSFRSVAQNTPEAQRLFRLALQFAEENIHFSVRGAKLFVEAIQGGEDAGFGMLITRVCSDHELEDAISACSYPGTLRHSTLDLGRKTSVKEFYRFADFDTVCSAAEQISHLYLGESALYQMQDRYYLYLEPLAECPMEEIRLRLCEFGSLVEQSRFMHGKLNEYGERMIAENAVKVMEEYFCVR